MSEERKTIYLCLAHMSEAGLEQKYVKEAFDTNWVVPLGPNVNAFEKDLENFVGEGKKVVALSAGTAAVHLALLACGVGPGDEVCVQSFTFCASSHPITYLGATPVFIDSEKDSWNMDPDLLEEAIKDRIAKTGKKPKAIVPVALYGMPYDCDRIMDIANRYDIPVIEDAAEGFGSRWKGRVLGTFGKFGVLSFNGNKMITNSIEDNYQDFKNFTFANGWISSWCAVCLLCLYQHFIRAWIGEEYLFPPLTVYLMVMYFFLPRLTTMTYTYREAAGLWWEDRFRPLAATVVNLILNIMLVQIIGMNGVIISTLVCTIFINVPWGSYILFKNYFQKTLKEYFGQLFYYLIVTNIAGFTTFEICNLLPTTGWGILFIKAFICCIVPNVIFFAFYRNMKELKYTQALVNKILTKVMRRT